MIKSLVKNVLPPRAINTIRLIKDRRALNTLTSLAFDADNLRPAHTFDPAPIWNDADITRDWEADIEMISTFLTPGELDQGVNPGDRRAIYSLIKVLQPKSFLEIGTHIGVSTLFIACAMQSNGGGHITTVDIYDVNDETAQTWKRWGASASPRGLLEKAGCADMVTFKTGGALDHMRTTNDKYDMIFLDGDHGAGAVYQEIAAALKLLNPNGMILLHDVYPNGQALFRDGNIIHGPWQAARRIHAEAPNIQITPLGTLPWPTKQGSRATTLALALRR